jgi:hypothetical protein
LGDHAKEAGWVLAAALQVIHIRKHMLMETSGQFRLWETATLHGDHPPSLDVESDYAWFL